MAMKKNNKGFSLVELIIVIAIMAILVGVIAPSVIKYLDKAKQAKIEQEASVFMQTAKLSYIEVSVRDEGPLSDTVRHKTAKSSPYYCNGKAYGNLTNWTVLNGPVVGASNAPLAVELFDTMGIAYGKNWKSGTSTIPISESEPKKNRAGSTTDKCIFQLFYDADGKMVLEYSRCGFFVRMEDEVVVYSVKIKNAKEQHFTAWQ